MATNYKKRIINKKVAKEINADKREVDLIFQAISETLTDMIENKSTRKLRITHFGSFGAKSFRRWAINHQDKIRKLKTLGFIPDLNHKGKVQEEYE
jgi:nucleoid DNA-binding protein